MGQKYTVRSKGAGPDLEDQFPSLRTRHFFFAEGGQDQAPSTEWGEMHSTPYNQTSRVNRNMSFTPEAVSPSICKILSCLLLPLGTGASFFLITARKSPLTILPTRDPSWDGLSCLHHSCWFPAPVASQRRGSLGAILSRQILCQH